MEVRRRDLVRLAAGASLPLWNEFALAQLSAVSNAPPDAVRINANENPLGPCPEAAEAMSALIRSGGRYMYNLAFELQNTLAASEGLPTDYVMPFAGSSYPLHHAVLAFTSAEKSLVVADPGYEAAEAATRYSNARVTRVPLRKDFAHDVRAMAADQKAGLIYICNPNNPTGTLTPHAEIEWLVANKPAGAVVLIDEAYIHIAGAPAASPLAAKDRDVIILRTFSKIYGMAGLRAGAALGRPDLLRRLRAYNAGGLPITAMAGAVASLKAKNLVEQRRKIIADTRGDVFGFLEKHNFKYVPSVSNKFMIDVQRPGWDVVKALAGEKVLIGRVWPSWPNHVRVSVGTPEEMRKFKAAFLKVMA